MTELVGPMSGSGFRQGNTVRRTCRGHEVAWGSDTGEQHPQEIRKSEEREGRTPLDRPPPTVSTGSGADTAVSIEREVVSGHAYAILAPDAVIDGWCGHDKPTRLSVDGVADPITLGPGAHAPGPSTWR